MADGNLTLKEFMKLPLEEKVKRYRELSSRDQFGARMADVTPRSVVVMLCSYCIYNHKDGTCDAFPDGIPSKHMGSVTENPETPCGNNLSFKRKDAE
jgi:hypothetical protein